LAIWRRVFSSPLQRKGKSASDTPITAIPFESESKVPHLIVILNPGREILPLHRVIICLGNMEKGLSKPFVLFVRKLVIKALNY